MSISKATQFRGNPARSKSGRDANCAMVHHISLVPEFKFGVGYFFPLSLKFSAK
jgi:hypothetical protein